MATRQPAIRTAEQGGGLVQIKAMDMHKTTTTQAMTASDVYKAVLKDYPDVLNVPQISNVLGISTKMAYRLLNNGELQSLRVGREYKVPKLYLLQYMRLLSRNAEIS